jgi:hypothetical protein
VTPDLLTLSLFVPWIVCWVNIIDSPRANPMHLDYRFFLSPGEHAVSRLKHCETSGCQGYGFLRIKLIPRPHVESSGEHSDVFYSWMGMRRNLVISGEFKAERKGLGFLQVPFN